jgi:hypothetical protein
VVLDANVIYSEIARTTYLHAHLRGACRVHWSTRILDETFTALARNYGSAEKFERVRLLMLAAVPQAARDAVDLPYGASLPHPNDAHVIGTAMACEADWIATFNLKHFPNAVLKPMGIRAEHPDIAPAAFLLRAPSAAAETRDALIEERATDPESLATALKRARMRRTALALGLPAK